MELRLTSVARIAQEATVSPTLFDPSVLGLEGSRQAWNYAKRAYIDNPLPVAMRAGLLSACWEGSGRSSPAIHMTGLSLLGQPEELVDLGATWEAMIVDPDRRAVLASTIRIGNGHEVPANVQRQVRHSLGPWTRAWQDLCMFAGWCDRLYSVHAVDVAPLADPRVEAWMKQLIGSAHLIKPFTRAVE